MKEEIEKLIEKVQKNVDKASEGHMGISMVQAYSLRSISLSLLAIAKMMKDGKGL